MDDRGECRITYRQECQERISQYVLQSRTPAVAVYPFENGEDAGRRHAAVTRIDGFEDIERDGMLCVRGIKYDDVICAATRNEIEQRERRIAMRIYEGNTASFFDVVEDHILQQCCLSHTGFPDDVDVTGPVLGTDSKRLLGSLSHTDGRVVLCDRREHEGRCVLFFGFGFRCLFFFWYWYFRQRYEARNFWGGQNTGFREGGIECRRPDASAANAIFIRRGGEPGDDRIDRRVIRMLGGQSDGDRDAKPGFGDFSCDGVRYRPGGCLRACRKRIEQKYKKPEQEPKRKGEDPQYVVPSRSDECAFPG